jgi:hypothetical protein
VNKSIRSQCDVCAAQVRCYLRSVRMCGWLLIHAALGACTSPSTPKRALATVEIEFADATPVEGYTNNGRRAKRSQLSEEKAKKAEAKAQCDALGEACGKSAVSKSEIAAQCRDVVGGQVKTRCADEMIALLECYEKNICSLDDEILAYDDMRVLTERHKQCGDETKVAHGCAANESS